MVDRISRTEGRPRSRLEAWLVRALQSGHFEGLPSYRPPKGRGQRPEQYARGLLAGLEDGALGAWEQERLRDDGRAFRSWAEQYPAGVVSTA
jgi:hypothetical protein